MIDSKLFDLSGIYKKAKPRGEPTVYTGEVSITNKHGINITTKLSLGELPQIETLCVLISHQTAVPLSNVFCIRVQLVVQVKRFVRVHAVQRHGDGDGITRGILTSEAGALGRTPRPTLIPPHTPARIRVISWNVERAVRNLLGYFAGGIIISTFNIASNAYFVRLFP